MPTMGVRTLHRSRDGKAAIADGISDGQIRIEPAREDSISITVQPARNTFASDIRISRADALALAAELTVLASTD